MQRCSGESLFENEYVLPLVRVLTSKRIAYSSGIDKLNSDVNLPQRSIENDKRNLDKRLQGDDRHVAHSDRNMGREDLQSWLEEAGAWHCRCDREGYGREAWRNRDRISPRYNGRCSCGRQSTEGMGKGFGAEAG
jgi:hypothetical protein